MTKIKILIADDHAVVREGTRRILDQEDDLEVVEGVRGIDEAAPILLKNAKIEFNDRVRYEYLVTIGEDEARELVKESMGLEIIAGRDIRKGGFLIY